MPHLRTRYLSPILLKALKFSPAVGLLGQRQTGKTTLISHLTQNYRSLDDRKNLELALQEPETFLELEHPPFAIDECQLAPPLFPAIKEYIRLHPGPGQFIMTGSVRFTSRKIIRESLTGRIFNLELLPLSLAECYQAPLSELPLLIFQKSEQVIFSYLEKRKNLKLGSKKTSFLSNGGLPGICFQRDEFIRSGKFLTHLETLLERDLRLLIQTRLSFSSLSGLLGVLARRQGIPLDLSDLSRVSRISRPTLRNLLAAFEALFLIRVLPAQGGTAKPMLLFEDQGLASFLAKTHLDPFIDLYRLLFVSILPQFKYRPEINSQVFHYLTRGGAHVPLAFETKYGALGFIPEMNSVPSSSSIGSAKSFLKHFPESKVIIAHSGQDLRCLDRRIFSIPVDLCF